MIKEVILEADDLQPYVYPIPHLEQLKKHIPNFKITLFTIAKWRPEGKAIDPKQELEDHKRFYNMLQQYDWIELAYHGLDHSMKQVGNNMKYEFHLKYNETKERMKQIEDWNRQVGANFVKVFRAPYWEISEDARRAIRDMGYIMCPDRNRPRPTTKNMKMFVWNWSFEEELPDIEILKGHGHVSLPSRNNIPDQMENLKRLPQDAEYLFISEYIKKHGSD